MEQNLNIICQYSPLNGIKASIMINSLIYSVDRKSLPICFKLNFLSDRKGHHCIIIYMSVFSESMCLMLISPSGCSGQCHQSTLGELYSQPYLLESPGSILHGELAAFMVAHAAKNTVLQWWQFNSILPKKWNHLKPEADIALYMY